MSDLERFSVSLEKPLHQRLELLLEQSGYANRSEFIRDLIRARLVDEEWKQNEEALGAIMLVYDHHKRGVGERLTELQHQFHRLVLVSTHVHLDNHLCAESIVVRGRAKRIEELANAMRKEKGVLHVALSMGSTGKRLR